MNGRVWKNAKKVGVKPLRKSKLKSLQLCYKVAFQVQFHQGLTHFRIIEFHIEYIFRASTPVHQTQVIYHGESSEDLTRPNTPNPFPSNQSVSSFKQEEVTLKLEPVTEEKSDDKVVLSEGEDSSGEFPLTIRYVINFDHYVIENRRR